jgi:hypothetical protein
MFCGLKLVEDNYQKIFSEPAPYSVPLAWKIRMLNIGMMYPNIFLYA